MSNIKKPEGFALVKETLSNYLALGRIYAAKRAIMTPAKFERYFLKTVPKDSRFNIRAAMRVARKEIDWNSPDSILDAYRDLGLLKDASVVIFLEEAFAEIGIG